MEWAKVYFFVFLNFSLNFTKKLWIFHSTNSEICCPRTPQFSMLRNAMASTKTLATRSAYSSSSLTHAATRSAVGAGKYWWDAAERGTLAPPTAISETAGLKHLRLSFLFSMMAVSELGHTFILNATPYSTGCAHLRKEKKEWDFADFADFVNAKISGLFVFYMVSWPVVWPVVWLIIIYRCSHFGWLLFYCVYG